VINGMERGRIHPTALVSDRAELGTGVTVGAYACINDGVVLGDDAMVGPHAVLGEPQQGFYREDGYENAPLVIGRAALIRSGTIIYAGTTIGEGFECGHRVTIREGARIGRNVRIGTLSDVQGHCDLGDYVRLHSNVHIGHRSTIGNYVWIFPYVVLTNDPHPPSDVLLGVTVEEFAVIATMSVILPGVRIGRDALVGASSMVRRDVEPEAVVAGNPATRVASVRDVKSKQTGQPVYPWRDHYTRGMPWEELGYARWSAAESGAR
jgi:acyl-[acyl carrier protein]--UDP-N-acetylglucosamine O-acyltransferase